MMKTPLSYRLRHGCHHLNHRLHDHHRQCLRLSLAPLVSPTLPAKANYSTPPASPPPSRALPSDPDCVIFRNCHFIITFARMPLFYVPYDGDEITLHFITCICIFVKDECEMCECSMNVQMYTEIINNWSSNFLATYLADFFSI